MKFRIVFCIFLLLSFGLIPALACSPTATPLDTTPIPPPNISYFAERAPVVFIGTVLREVPIDSWHPRYEIQVESYLKGSSYDIIHIDGYGYGTDCSPILYIGTRHIFFVNQHMNSAGIPIYTRITDFEATDAHIATISALTGESYPAQPLPLDMQLTRLAENKNAFWFLLPLIAVSLSTSLLVFMLLRRKGRKPKAKREELL